MHTLKYIYISLIWLAVLPLNTLGQAGVSEIPPVNDIQILNSNGEQIQATRCATADTAYLTIPRAPKDIFSWRQANPKSSQPIEIPVNFNIIMTSNGKGAVRDKQIVDQISVLNKAFTSSKISFTIRAIKRFTNDFYYNVSPGFTEFFMKMQYNEDSRNTLNLYLAAPGNGVLGWASLPWMYDESSFLHGVVILNDTLPGGNTGSYSLGHTTVHEVGHYLGLYHTFQGGCMEPGDYVEDTPFEAEANYNCPIDKDSCTADGKDPIHNYMDYSDDSCMDHFTKLQSDRIDWAISNYKPSLK